MNVLKSKELNKQVFKKIYEIPNINQLTENFIQFATANKIGEIWFFKISKNRLRVTPTESRNKWRLQVLYRQW